MTDAADVMFAGTPLTPLRYAQALAEALWEKHWKDDAPEWRVQSDLLGVLTQIDNMTAGLIRAHCQAPSPDEIVDGVNVSAVARALPLWR